MSLIRCAAELRHLHVRKAWVHTVDASSIAGVMARLTLVVFCCLLLIVTTESIVIGSAPPEPSVHPDIALAATLVAQAITTGDVTAAADSIKATPAAGTHDLLWRTLQTQWLVRKFMRLFFVDHAGRLATLVTASLEQADSLYAANHSGGPSTLVLGAPYKPYNHTASALRAGTLGKALQQAAVPSSLQADAYSNAFTQSFLQQNSTFQGLYGGFTVAMQTLVAVEASNQPNVFALMFAQVLTHRLLNSSALFAYLMLLDSISGV